MSVSSQQCLFYGNYCTFWSRLKPFWSHFQRFLNNYAVVMSHNLVTFRLTLLKHTKFHRCLDFSSANPCAAPKHATRQAAGYVNPKQIFAQISSTKNSVHSFWSRNWLKPLSIFLLAVSIGSFVHTLYLNMIYWCKRISTTQYCIVQMPTQLDVCWTDGLVGYSYPSSLQITKLCQKEESTLWPTFICFYCTQISFCPVLVIGVYKKKTATDWWAHSPLFVLSILASRFPINMHTAAHQPGS